MGTMNFSIPDDIKDDFNQTFAHENKSAVVAKLLREAVVQARRKQQSDEAIDRILARLGQERTRVSDEEIRRAREEGRP
ncbi:MAG: hypothetical protein WAS49_08200 [Candidatus Dechloromonas phosphoritropha]